MASKPQSAAPVATLDEAPSFDSMIGIDAVLAVPEEETTTNVAMRLYGDDASAILDASDVQMPKFRLAQQQTAEVVQGEAKAGQFVLSGFEPLDRPTLVILRVAKTREARDKMDDDAIKCQSPDARFGYGDAAFRNGYGEDNLPAACEACPLAKWTPNPKDPKKNFPPVCAESYGYLGYVPEHDTVVAIDFKRTSISTAKQINGWILRWGLGNFAVRLSSQENTNTRGRFFTPVAVMAKVDPEVLANARDAFGA
jgi:hypothetical protein